MELKQTSAETVRTLQQIQQDAWTRQDHADYDERIRGQLNALEERLRALEVRTGRAR